MALHSEEGWRPASQRHPRPNPWGSEHMTLQSRGDLAGVIKLRTLTWEMILRLSGDSKKEAGRSELDPDMMMEAGWSDVSLWTNALASRTWKKSGEPIPDFSPLSEFGILTSSTVR